MPHQERPHALRLRRVAAVVPPQDVIQDLVPEDAALDLVLDRELWIEAELVEMLTEKAEAEGMQCADMRGFNNASDSATQLSSGWSRCRSSSATRRRCRSSAAAASL